MIDIIFYFRSPIAFQILIDKFNNSWCFFLGLWKVILTLIWTIWWPFKQVSLVLKRWCIGAFKSFVGPNGYIAIVTLLGAYVGLYSIMEARHERRMNGARIERTTFMSMASSGNSASFVAAMKNFGPLQGSKRTQSFDLLDMVQGGNT